MSKGKVNVAIVGLGFGAQFIPIYKRHPLANMYAICRRSKAALDAVGNAFAVERRYQRFEDVLADREVDFVHINSPLADHGWMTIAALKAGKHVMCTVPMAISVDECRRDCRARSRDGAQIYDGRNGSLLTGISIRSRTLSQRAARADSISARKPPPGHGRLAGRMAGVAADVLRDALRRTLPLDPGRGG